MFRSPVTTLSLCFLLAGCGSEDLQSAEAGLSQALRSPECDQGMPVIASGRISLGQKVPKTEVTATSLALAVEEQNVLRVITAEVHVSGSPEFPLAFTLCGDPSSWRTDARLYAQVELGRASKATFREHLFISFSYEGKPREDLQLIVGEEVYWGPY
jgi:hypothetical protein